VTDHGPGVPITERKQIFRRFWRRDRRRAGSAGLGLSILSRIVEMHGATMTVEDRSGGGTIFSICFLDVIEGATTSTRQFETAL